MDMKIALIDSGVGGLNVLFALMSHHPHHDYIYIADNLCAPYGSHSYNNIGKRLSCLIQAVEHKVDAVVLACNTASLVLKDGLDCYSIPVIPTYPTVQHEEDAIVLATPLSIDLLATITPRGVDLVACPVLASQVELMLSTDGSTQPDMSVLLDGYKDCKYCYIGCTHYVFVADLIKSHLPHAQFYDGIDDVLERFSALKLCKNDAKSHLSIFFTGAKEDAKYKSIIKKYFNPKLPIAFISVL